MTLHATLVTQEQNEAMRRMTSARLVQGEESGRLAKASMALKALPDEVLAEIVEQVWLPLVTEYAGRTG